MHFKIICLFSIFLFIGCSIDSPVVESDIEKKVVLKKEQSCILSAQEVVRRLMKSDRVFLSKELFTQSQTIIVSTQNNIESPISEHQISREFRLRKDDGICYIGEFEMFRIINREEISCSCIREQ